MLHEWVWDEDWRGFVCKHCGASLSPEDMAAFVNEFATEWKCSDE